MKISINAIGKTLLYGSAFFLSLALTQTILPNDKPKTADPSQSPREIIVDHRYLQLNIYENGEVKTIADMLAKGCDNNDLCEIEKTFKYVSDLPYKTTSLDKKPDDVINQNGGDCDEKSFLFASLLLQRKHESLLIVTKDHAFIAVHVENEKELKKPHARLVINGKNYYYAEVTAKESRIGQFNGIRPSSFEVIYDVTQKKEIPKESIRFYES